MSLEDLFAKIPQALADHARDINHIGNQWGKLSEQPLCGSWYREELQTDEPQVKIVSGYVEVDGRKEYHNYAIEFKPDGAVSVIDHCSGQFYSALPPGQRISRMVELAPGLFIQPDHDEPGVQVLYGDRNEIAAQLGLKYQPNQVFDQEFWKREDC